MPVLTGSVHAHILTKPSRPGFAGIRLELIEPGTETCVYKARYVLLPISLSGNLKMDWVSYEHRVPKITKNKPISVPGMFVCLFV